MANGPWPFRKANRGAQQPGRLRPIEQWARWLIDPKSWVLTISELMCLLDAQEDKMSYEYQTWDERSMPLNTGADLLAHLMHLSEHYTI